MTLNLLTWVPEGFVLLTDSMSTSETFMPFHGPKVTTYDHAMKMFELGRDVRAGAMISGLGVIGETLASQLMKSASAMVDSKNSSTIAHADCVHAVAVVFNPVYEAMLADAKQFVLDQIKQNPIGLAQINANRNQRGAAPLDSIEHLSIEDIGIENMPGIDPKAYDYVFPAPVLQIVVASHMSIYEACVLRWPGALQTIVVSESTQVGSVWWWGSGGSVVSRVIKGFDMDLLQSEHAGDQPAEAVLSFAQERAAKYQMPTLLGVMPLQEAVYFTEYLGDVASGYDRFKAGHASVGGAINVMIITDQERRWLRQDRIQARPVSVQ